MSVLSSALEDAELSEASTSTTISTDSNQHAAASYAAILGRPGMDLGKRPTSNNNIDDDDDFYTTGLLNVMVTSSSSPTCQLDSSSASLGGIAMVPQSGLGADHDLAVKKEDLDGILGMELQDNSIAGWLGRLGLSQYIDCFQNHGFDNLFQLTDFSQENLERMNIPAQHRSKIWKSLLEFHQANQLSDVTQALGRSSGMTADTFLSSQMTASQPSQQSQQSVYNPGFYEVTRYTFKHTISMTKHSVTAKPQQQQNDESESPSKKSKSDE
ncbi:hypothetical protein ElyMa_006251400 [Elysia marginata]|uniref:SAM domain-containing protein n=1 Tax=Elysia marginata TaxID=1093978 RepID=A0AAV4H9V4_9GAST|nr:hypothetical protein ElyMa_006251400 [Elysia marginata]